MLADHLTAQVSRIINLVTRAEKAGLPVSNYLPPGELRTAGLLARCAGIKTQAHMERVVWRAIRDLYSGSIEEFGFIDAMTTVIRQQLTRAWREGAGEVGVTPEEFEPQDNDELERIIANEFEFISGLAIDIIMDRDAEEPKGVERFRFRARLWAQRYKETVNDAKIWFGGRQKLKWVLGATEEHCITCLALSGVVASTRLWEQSKIRPQNPPNELLACKGWLCDCALVPTNERQTYGALDLLLSIAMEVAGR